MALSARTSDSPRRPISPSASRASGDKAERVDSTDSADATFWRGFGDPLLSRLIGDALDGNQDVWLAQAKFDRYPTVTASGEIGHQLLSRDQAFGAPRDARDTPISSAQFNSTCSAAWRRSVEASRADTETSAADIRAVRASRSSRMWRMLTSICAARARAQFESTTSRIAVYEASIGVDEHRLAVLTGGVLPKR
ncbi:RND efflux system, outer membrane lipoprotein CmeC [Candidatus Burkholderia brachyanthoides]|nr:RND efflux system, outer membrane lipoprotein CmeC [Candidatus Burkholderia brachyanthoides]